MFSPAFRKQFFDVIRRFGGGFPGRFDFRDLCKIRRAVFFEQSKRFRLLLTRLLARILWRVEFAIDPRIAVGADLRVSRRRNEFPSALRAFFRF
jgi:hypothetical protein